MTFTTEEITAMAKEAGGGLSCIAEPLEHPWKFSQVELERFATLVAEKAEAKERDLCANHIEDCKPPIAVHGNRVEIGIVTRVAYANSIRDRGQKGGV